MKIISIMELGSRLGIAGRYGFFNMDDVMKFKPFREDFEGNAGSSLDALHVTAITSTNDRIPLEEEWENRHACNYDPTTRGDAPSIGEQIAGMENVVALEFFREAYATYRGNEDDEFCEEILLIKLPDWESIRRRLEQRLKHADNIKLFNMATEFGISIY